MSSAKSRGLGWAGVQRVEDVLLTCPEGCDSRHVAKVTGYAVTSASKALGELAHAGRAMHLRGRYGQCTWFHASFRRTMWERQQAALRERLPHNKLRTEERQARFLAFEDAPVHRVIPAHLAAPLRPAGPASVWGLAA